ncbi:MAG TPA: alpha/beta hydrolase, partial [Puia sp.]|nr:alpha/beta hydrolase [Puia sp.]
MTRRYVDIDGLSISYLESSQKADKTLFLLHGNSNAATLWRHQFNDPQLSSCRLVAFDLPGHGCSAGSGNPNETYNVIAMGAILGNAIHLLARRQPFVLAGLSLGSNILAEMLAGDLSPNGIILVSSTIVGKDISPSQVVMEGASASVLYEDNPPREAVARYLDECMYAGDPADKQRVLREYLDVKPGFRSSLKASIPAGLYSDEIGILRRRQLPVLSIYGLKEKITNPHLLDAIPLPYWRGGIIK